MSARVVFGITRIISKAQEDRAGFDLVALEFAQAYAALRKDCPLGDLRIHLSIETDSKPLFDIRTPAQWNCPYCGYGEYKNHPDWERRAADHVDVCPQRPVIGNDPGDETCSRS